MRPSAVSWKASIYLQGVCEQYTGRNSIQVERVTKKRFICFSMLVASLHRIVARSRTHRVHQFCHRRKFHSGNESNIRRRRSVALICSIGCKAYYVLKWKEVIVCAWHCVSTVWGDAKMANRLEEYRFINSCCADMRYANSLKTMETEKCMYRIVIIISDAEDGPLFSNQQTDDNFHKPLTHTATHLTHSVESFSFAPIRSMCHFTFSKAFTISIIIIICAMKRYICAVDTKQHLQMLFRRNTVFSLSRLTPVLWFYGSIQFETEANRNIYWTLGKWKMLVSTRNHFWIWCSTPFHDTL